MKILVPVDELARGMPAARDIPESLTYFIGVCELLGAAGLILPGITKTRTASVPIAAAGLCAIASLATLFHIVRAEWSSIPLPIMLAATSAFIVRERWFHARVPSR